MVLVVKSGGAAAFPEWQALFAEFMPELEVRAWDDPSVAREAVEYALVWEPTPGQLARYPNLRLILSSAAGVDHILADPELPSHLPIVRMVTPDTVERMADFVTAACYALIRDFPRIVALQRERRWNESLCGRLASETQVAVMGLGQLGAAAARRLALNGFAVRGWARSEKAIDGVRCFAGDAQRDTFLAECDVLVNLLPDTPETRGIIDAALLGRLPRGAAVINVGRGSHLDARALLEALDAQHVSAAVLDVFATEPLPKDDPLWQHPGIWVTPHIASAVPRRPRARQVADCIAAQRRGEAIPHLYDRQRGY